jgi:hypothetical protein
MMGLICAMIFSGDVNYDQKVSNEHEQLVHNILRALAFEHIFSYFCDFFRKWEIAKWGQLDMNGVYRGKRESIL